MPGRKREQEQISWQHLIPPLIVLALAILVCTALLAANHITEASASVVRSLIWPFFVVTIVLLFRPQAEALINAILEKIEAAVKVSVTTSGVNIETGPRQIPVPASGEPVTLSNLALLHTSFVRADKTEKFNDGLTYYQIEIVIAAPKPTLDRVARVTYRLDPSYPAREYVVTDASNRFKLRELANGTSIVRAEIEFKDQGERLYVNRFIDLRPDGPHI